MSTLFDRSVKGCVNWSLWPNLPEQMSLDALKGMLGEELAILPEVSELEVVRRYTCLSQPKGCPSHCHTSSAFGFAPLCLGW